MQSATLGKKVTFHFELRAAAPAHARLFHSEDLPTDQQLTEVLVGTREQFLSAKNVFLSPNLCEFDQIFPP